jgi:hypothetical protein
MKLPPRISTSNLSTLYNNKYPIIGPNSIMSQKEHGTCASPPLKDLKYSVDWNLAKGVCCYNRQYAEPSGYFLKTSWLSDIDRSVQTKYYDSITGKHLFTAPGKSRTFDEFLKESMDHGWPSFRDDEVNWENVRVLEDTECVSVDGTHLGHNIPDEKGNRYCINLASIAGSPQD